MPKSKNSIDLKKSKQKENNPYEIGLKDNRSCIQPQIILDQDDNVLRPSLSAKLTLMETPAFLSIRDLPEKNKNVEKNT